MTLADFLSSGKLKDLLHDQKKLSNFPKYIGWNLFVELFEPFRYAKIDDPGLKELSDLIVPKHLYNEWFGFLQIYYFETMKFIKSYPHMELNLKGFIGWGYLLPTPFVDDINYNGTTIGNVKDVINPIFYAIGRENVKNIYPKLAQTLCDTLCFLPQLMNKKQISGTMSTTTTTTMFMENNPQQFVDVYQKLMLTNTSNITAVQQMTNLTYKETKEIQTTFEPERTGYENYLYWTFNLFVIYNIVKYIFKRWNRKYSEAREFQQRSRKPFQSKLNGHDFEELSSNFEEFSIFLKKMSEASIQINEKIKKLDGKDDDDELISMVDKYLIDFFDQKKIDDFETIKTQHRSTVEQDTLHHNKTHLNLITHFFKGLEVNRLF